MPHHISNMGGYWIRWVEEQPVVRPARMRFEQDGVILTLIKKLEGDKEQQRAEERREYGYGGRPQRYVCFVS